MKNYADIYESNNDSISLEQAIYVRAEPIDQRGVFTTPQDDDYFLNLPGGGITIEQPRESSPQRSGRHHVSTIRKKVITNWNFSSYYNLNADLGLDAGIRLLHRSLFGNEVAVAGTGLTYNTARPPNFTFTILECSDRYARQAVGAFVNSGNINLPGEGEASVAFSGSAADGFLVGIGKSSTANTGNTIVLEGDDIELMSKGGAVMIIKSDGVSRGADTPNGSSRIITGINKAAKSATLSGEPLTDVDGSTDPIYLCYYEPENPSATENPVTGLDGEITIAGYPNLAVRSLSIQVDNNHEIQNFFYGRRGLGGKLFAPTGRFTAQVTATVNMNDDSIRLFNNVKRFESQAIKAILGDPSDAERHLELAIPKADFDVPGFSIPDSGSVPTDFVGNCYVSQRGATELALTLR